jgi:deoxyribodipyrimidine photolyase-related protein
LECKRQGQEAILMSGAEPIGGQWNFDEDNRKSTPKSGQKNLKAPMRFPPDQLTRTVISDLAQRLPDQVGLSQSVAWPVTRADGLLALDDFIEHRLSSFGPTQDAMWMDEPFLSHSLLSVALKLKLVNPHEVIDAATNAYNDPYRHRASHARQLGERGLHDGSRLGNGH